MRGAPWRTMARNAAVIAAVSGGLAGCASLRAGTEPARPPLHAPEPPPRVIAIVPDEPGPTPVIVPASPAPKSVRQPPARATEKPEPIVVPVPEPPPIPVSDTAPPGASLSAGTDAPASAWKIRETLGQATRDLQRVDERTLSAAARTQLDAARRFVVQAEEALAARHYRFAQQLADKAAGIAAGLVKR